MGKLLRIVCSTLCVVDISPTYQPVEKRDYPRPVFNNSTESLECFKDRSIDFGTRDCSFRVMLPLMTDVILLIDVEPEAKAKSVYCEVHSINPLSFLPE